MDLQEEKKPAQWALDFFELTEFDRSNNFFKFYSVPITAFAFGAAMPLKNISRGFPPFINKPQTTLFTIMGIIVGICVKNVSEYHFGRRDEMVREYIRKFPEEFPEPDNTRYGDRFLPWNPIR